MQYRSPVCSITVLPDGTINLEVFGVLGFALDTCAIHLPQAGDLVLRAVPTTQARLQGWKE